MWLTCRYKYGDDLMSVVSTPSDNGTSNWFEVSLEFLWSHRYFSQRLFAVLSGTSVLGPCISFVSSSHCQCHAWRCLAGEGHNVFDDRENAVGRHLAKLFLLVFMEFTPCSVEQKSCMQMPPTFNYYIPLLMTNFWTGWDPRILTCKHPLGRLSVCVHLNNTVRQMRTVCKPVDLKPDDNWVSIAHRFSILFGKS